MFRSLLIFPVVSRGAMVLLAYLSPYARLEGGLGEAMTTLTTGRTLALAGGSAIVLVGLAGHWRGLAALAVAAALTWGWHSISGTGWGVSPAMCSGR